jgi:DNA repair protein RecN (Recombination protein N)
MLSQLSVSNLAVMENATVEFSGGLNIITGETGAGKSVLMNALTLLLGSRADATQVRDGAKEARLEALFDISPDSKAHARLSSLLDDAGLPPCEDGQLVLRRSVSSSGGGRVHVNDAPSTVQTLRSIGKILVDKHGPHDRQALYDAAFRLGLVDAYAGLRDDADALAYRKSWDVFRTLLDKRKELEGDTSDFESECERLRDTVDELESARLCGEDDEDLSARHAAAAHAAEILDSANFVTAALSGDDSSACAALIAAGGRLSEMSRYHQVAAEWAEEVESLTIRVQELSRSIADSVSRIDADPETLQALDDRLSLVQRLKRKYARRTAAELLAFLEEKKNRLADLEDRDALIAELAKKISAAEKDVADAAAKLTSKRKAAAEKFSKAVTKELHGLGFLKSGFKTVLESKAPDSSGADEIVFLFEPNPGEAARPLEDIASTGETARVMLAVKAVAAEHDETGVLVFDEIDSNIGGEVGRAVGERLRSVAKHRQVISITHLPQSAVYGETHFVVSKEVVDGRTKSLVGAVEGEARIAEISRMLGGDSLTSVVKQHARELLEQAEKPKI